MFIDEVDIHVAAGDGGRGCVSFRREKYVPRGGPNGGDGGNGGSVYFIATSHLNSLHSFRFHPEFGAARGAHGQGSNRTGKTGADLFVDVPVGTVVYERTGDGLTLLGDLNEEGSELLVAKGGHGGRGNARFATATNRAPRRAEPGVPGQERAIRLELKLIADVGLVGFPNAGKSTFISRVSAARPKIADYPFTTLVPNLGVVALSGDRTFVVADVPGLIEGAHLGHGLGHQFLRHLERTKVLVHLVDVSSTEGRDPVRDLEVIERELAEFHGREDISGETPRPRLDQKPRVVAASKLDAAEDPSRVERLREAVAARGLPFFAVSAVTGAGMHDLLEAAWEVRGSVAHGSERTGTARRTGKELEPCARACPVAGRRRAHGRVKMRIGVLGGTFDPIHLGHLDAARAARHALALEKVLILPSQIPPHRARLPHASGYHRFAMAAIAMLDDPSFVVSDLELERRGPSYWYDTLRSLQEMGWSPEQLFFITGVDAFAEIATWHAYPAVLDAGHFVIVTRPGHSPDAVRARLPQLASRFVEASAFGHDHGEGGVVRTSLIFVDAPTTDVSSTEIRRRLQAGGPLAGLVPDAVDRYIRQHQLYAPLAAAPQLHGQI